MSNDDTDYAAYRGAIETIGESVRDRVRAGEDEVDATHEEVDGSWWIIYTHASIAVLRHSQNDDAIFDDMGSDALQGCASMSEVYTRAAYYAMRQDVAEWVRDNPAEDEDEDEDE